MAAAAAATTTTTTTTTSSEESTDIENLYGFGERLSQAKDKSQNVKDYEGIITAAKGGTTKAKQLAAQLIPRFFHYFPQLHDTAANAHFDLCEEEEIGVRVQAIRGLPLFCKDTPEFVSRIVDILAQLLMAEENVERDAVQKALMSLLRQDVKASLTALFKHVESVDESTDENIRDKVLTFIRDKVFSLKAELLKPQEQMERHITDLIKKVSFCGGHCTIVLVVSGVVIYRGVSGPRSLVNGASIVRSSEQGVVIRDSLRDVTGGEFKMFIDFLKTLSIFDDKAPRERVQELMEIIESQADLDSQFDSSDVDHIDRLISCLYIAIPFFIRGASNSNFFNYVSEHIVPVLDKLPEERKLDLLKNLAESSPHTIPQDARQILPSIVQLLKKYMPQKRTGEEMNFTYAECLLYTFHHLASKTSNATNSLCGYKIVTGQPSDRIGEDFSEQFKDFQERLTCVEDLSRATVKKLTLGMSVQNKKMATASNEVKEKIKNEKQSAAAGLKTCNNILAMTQPLHKSSPLFIGDKRIILSWKEDAKSAVIPVRGGSGGKRPASTAINGSNNAAKKGRGAGGSQNQLVSRAFNSIGYRGRGGGRGGRGRGWGGRGRDGLNQFNLMLHGLHRPVRATLIAILEHPPSSQQFPAATTGPPAAPLLLSTSFSSPSLTHHHRNTSTTIPYSQPPPTSLTHRPPSLPRPPSPAPTTSCPPSDVHCRCPVGGGGS
ncbi:hypothetical protein KSS87_008228 [Heliosperma pusillum]|nr:hypothetical protein KSS87_008228 [Heliosperma pusillum]